VCRETKEECGLDVTSLDKVGVIMFEFLGQPQLMEVHVFRTRQYTGSPVETEGAEIDYIVLNMINCCCCCCFA